MGTSPDRGASSRVNYNAARILIACHFGSTWPALRWLTPDWVHSRLIEAENLWGISTRELNKTFYFYTPVCVLGCLGGLVRTQLESEQQRDNQCCQAHFSSIENFVASGESPRGEVALRSGEHDKSGA